MNLDSQMIGPGKVMSINNSKLPRRTRGREVEKSTELIRVQNLIYTNAGILCTLKRQYKQSHLPRIIISLPLSITRDLIVRDGIQHRRAGLFQNLSRSFRPLSTPPQCSKDEKIIEENYTT